MKKLKLTLAILLAVTSLWVLGMLVVRTSQHGWHYPPLHSLLFIGLPVALLVAAILQYTTPGAAALILVVLLPLGTGISVFSFLPFGGIAPLLPRALQVPACIIQNLGVVGVSLVIWLSTRRKIHNKQVDASSNSRASASA